MLKWINVKELQMHAHNASSRIPTRGFSIIFFASGSKTSIEEDLGSSGASSGKSNVSVQMVLYDNL